LLNKGLARNLIAFMGIFIESDGPRIHQWYLMGIMMKRSDKTPPTTIRPRRLSNVAMLGVVGVLLLVCILLRRDIFTDWGAPVWWLVSIMGTAKNSPAPSFNRVESR